MLVLFLEHNAIFKTVGFFSVSQPIVSVETRSDTSIDSLSGGKTSAISKSKECHTSKRKRTPSPSREDLHRELITQEIGKVKLEKKNVSLERVKLKHEIKTTKWHDTVFSCVQSGCDGHTAGTA